ncbi:hypothetical protein LC605_32370 [Nostoc sp. CHAB 5836]|uniref:hypothetical protein n=1 Tax=Nostoc sp. CHAB 5836 TaxID=2780404 RepID=UPI001E51F2D7|nr:hypothetical protein [Nostoc sp. CHAB 5836]MCC5619649.1 hypothetical protein [Nostoc sp. CHAB 5836]
MGEWAKKRIGLIYHKTFIKKGKGKNLASCGAFAVASRREIIRIGSKAGKNPLPLCLAWFNCEWAKNGKTKKIYFEARRAVK